MHSNWINESNLPYSYIYITYSLHQVTCKELQLLVINCSVSISLFKRENSLVFIYITNMICRNNLRQKMNWTHKVCHQESICNNQWTDQICNNQWTTIWHTNHFSLQLFYIIWNYSSRLLYPLLTRCIMELIVLYIRSIKSLVNQILTSNMYRTCQIAAITSQNKLSNSTNVSIRDGTVTSL